MSIWNPPSVSLKPFGMISFVSVWNREISKNVGEYFLVSITGFIGAQIRKFDLIVLIALAELV